MQLKGARVIVTGASSGIGRATALEFARRGARLALAARSETALHEVATEIHQRGGEAVVIPTDVAMAAQVERMTKETIRAVGGTGALGDKARLGGRGSLAHQRVPPVPAENVARRIANAVERNQGSVYVSWIPDRLGVAVNHLAGWAVSAVLRRWARRAEA